MIFYFLLASKVRRHPGADAIECLLDVLAVRLLCTHADGFLQFCDHVVFSRNRFFKCRHFAFQSCDDVILCFD